MSTVLRKHLLHSACCLLGSSSSSMPVILHASLSAILYCGSSSTVRATMPATVSAAMQPESDNPT
uniref:Uncharacterized protein n=1 Tax=Caenorhabditis japonica TaxID=281687 RepID=A0A8R1EC71_CAEJA